MKKTLLILFLLSSPLHAAEPDCECKSWDIDLLIKATKDKSDEALSSGSMRAKSKLALEGLKFAEACLEKNPDNTPCHYFRAVNRGIDLETRVLGVAKDLKLMIADFEIVTLNEPAFDDGGAFRALGYVYLKLPSLPILGDELKKNLGKAMEFAQRALSIAPNHSDNLLLYGEILLEEGNHALAAETLGKALDHLTSLPDVDQKRLKPEIEKYLKKAKKR